MGRVARHSSPAFLSMLLRPSPVLLNERRSPSGIEAGIAELTVLDEWIDMRQKTSTSCNDHCRSVGPPRYGPSFPTTLLGRLACPCDLPYSRKWLSRHPQLRRMGAPYTKHPPKVAFSRPFGILVGTFWLDSPACAVWDRNSPPALRPS